MNASFFFSQVLRADQETRLDNSNLAPRPFLYDGHTWCCIYQRTYPDGSIDAFCLELAFYTIKQAKGQKGVLLSLEYLEERLLELEGADGIWGLLVPRGMVARYTPGQETILIRSFSAFSEGIPQTPLHWPVPDTRQDHR